MSEHWPNTFHEPHGIAGTKFKNKGTWRNKYYNLQSLQAAHCFAEIKSALYKSKRIDVRVGNLLNNN